MTLRLLLMADTHVPTRAKDLPAQLWDAVAEADVVFHAGDWTSSALLDQLAARSERLIAVYGNNDGDALRERLPEIAHATLEGVRFSMIHETGPAKGREERCHNAFPDSEVLVFGHSHIPWDSTGPGELRLLNPGSPTDRRRQPACTYMTATVAAGKVTDVELVTVG